MWADLEQRVGEQVTLTGIALNAAAGAIVSLDGYPVYISGLRQWTETLFGQPIDVTGTLVFRPDPRPADSRSHKIGDSYALEDASWSASGSNQA